MQLAQRLNTIAEPQTIKMAKLGRELKAQGINIVDLSLGEPDFRTPDHINNAAIKAINDGYSKYTPVVGYPDLLQAICTKLKGITTSTTNPTKSSFPQAPNSLWQMPFWHW